MFDFFRDVVQELGGIDTTLAKKEREEKKEIEKLSRYIFSAGAKKIILTTGGLYLLLTVILIAGTVSTANVIGSVGNTILQIVKYIFLAAINIIVCVSIIRGTKRGEIIALAGCILFAVLLYASFFIN